MLTAKYYEKNNGYKYVLDTLKEQLGEETTVSMSDSTRAMVTEHSQDILVVIYCFENDIDLEKLTGKGIHAFEKYASVSDAESWIL